MTDEIEARLLKMADNLEGWASILDREYQRQLEVDETWTTLEISPERATKLINSLKAAAANLRHPDLLEIIRQEARAPR